MPNESFLQVNNISVTQHCLIGTPSDLRANNIEDETDKTEPYQNWLSGIAKAIPYYSVIDSGDVHSVRVNYNRYAKVYYTLATLECNVKKEWTETLKQYQGYFDQKNLFEYENTISEYSNENQPEVNIVSILADETIMKAEDFYTQKVHTFPDVKAVIYERLNNSQHFTTVLNRRNIKTREQIYKIELKMFENYSSEDFQFFVRSIPFKNDIDSYIKNKKLLYYKS